MSHNSKEIKKANLPAKILGIGGIFFKSKDPDKLSEWYKTYFKFSSNMKYEEGDKTIAFKWKTLDDDPHSTVWGPFKETTTYFEPAKKEFMINYVVQNLDSLLSELKESGIEVVGKIDSFEYGRFARVLDPEGNKIELWEPTEFGQKGLD